MPTNYNASSDNLDLGLLQTCSARPDFLLSTSFDSGFWSSSSQDISVSADNSASRTTCFKPRQSKSLTPSKHKICTMSTPTSRALERIDGYDRTRVLLTPSDPSINQRKLSDSWMASQAKRFGFRSGNSSDTSGPEPRPEHSTPRLRRPDVSSYSTRYDHQLTISRSQLRFLSFDRLDSPLRDSPQIRTYPMSLKSLCLVFPSQPSQRNLLSIVDL